MVKHPTHLPIIIQDEGFMYPFMISPIFTSLRENIDAINYSLKNSSQILVVCKKDAVKDSTPEAKFYDVGTVANILRKTTLSDGRIKVLVQGVKRGRIIETQESGDVLLGLVEPIEHINSEGVRTDAILQVLLEKTRSLAQTSTLLPPDVLKSIEDTADPNRAIDLTASVLNLKNEHNFELFSITDTQERLLRLIDFVTEEIHTQKLKKEIKSKVQSKMEKNNKEYFLREQLRQIQKELGGERGKDAEISKYKERIDALKNTIHEDAYRELSKQADRLSRMNPDSSDSNLLQNYLDSMLEIPFGKTANKKFKISSVQNQLDFDHFSLKKPKDRILEFFAVKELLAKRKIKQSKDASAILCFYGPPGVGKTSLANSIAKALGRSLVRIALGGLEDVNELRGHRRTYIGAMPGRILQGLIEAKEMNPVMVLDEIDKIGSSMRGDPTNALLEILDPEQNTHFRDHYANFNVDLSKVIFIATANEPNQIPRPLRDRMEMIEISSYTPQEKEQIAKKYLIPQELKKHGLKDGELILDDEALRILIENYTREAGVRGLRRQIARLSRKAARLILSGDKKITLTKDNLKDYLEKVVFEIDKADEQTKVGVVNGLAWTAVGGDVLKIEAIKIKGKGELNLTGSLGDVMKESAKIAHSLVKTLIDSKKLEIQDAKVKKQSKNESKNDAEVYDRYNIHLHVPEGATPKDGPSAGTAMTCAIASILSNKKIRAKTALTGEVTLSGEVLPIGGLKEKLIAAYKGGIELVLIPAKNKERDLDDLPDEVLNGLEIIGVEKIEQVIEKVLL